MYKEENESKLRVIKLRVEEMKQGFQFVSEDNDAEEEQKNPFKLFNENFTKALCVFSNFVFPF